MVIVDPIVAALDMRYNSHKDQNVRAVLSRLHQAAEEEGCAITLVGHLNKGSSTDAYTRVNLGPPQPWRIQDVRVGEDENGRH